MVLQAAALQDKPEETVDTTLPDGAWLAEEGRASSGPAHPCAHDGPSSPVVRHPLCRSHQAPRTLRTPHLAHRIPARFAGSGATRRFFDAFGLDGSAESCGGGRSSAGEARPRKQPKAEPPSSSGEWLALLRDGGISALQNQTLPTLKEYCKVGMRPLREPVRREHTLHATEREPPP